MKTARRRPGALGVTVAGIGVVGVSFGMARYGYGLLLPDLRAAYGLSTGALGAIAAGAYLAYLVASLAVGPLVTRLGARRVILLGGGCAAAGMLLAGLSQSPTVLAAGVLVGGASCGLVFPPFLDAVQALVAPERRARTFAAISSGTGWGVAIAAPVAIVAGSGWRAAWLTFAVLAVLATLWAARVLPDDRAGPAADAGDRKAVPPLRLAWVVCPRSGPLLAGALLVGLGASVYWTFAVDHLAGAGELPGAGTRLFLALVGSASVLGSFAGDLLERISARRAYRAQAALLAVAVALLALAPGSATAVAVSAVLFGTSFNLIIAILSLWAGRVFAERPSAGLGAVMFVLGAGMLAGPLVSGLLAAPLGLAGVLLGGAAVLAVAALPAPREELA